MTDSADFNIEAHHFQFQDGDGDVHDAVRIAMTRNGRTFNCVNHLQCFEDGESVLATLEPTIKELVKKLYPESFSIESIRKKRIKDAKRDIENLEKLIMFLSQAGEEDGPEV